MLLQSERPWFEGAGVVVVVSVLTATVGWTGLALGLTVVSLWIALPIVYPFAFGYIAYASFLNDGLFGVLYQAGLLAMLFGPFARSERSVKLTFVATVLLFLLIALIAAGQFWTQDVRVVAALLGGVAVAASFLVYSYGRYAISHPDRNYE